MGRLIGYGTLGRSMPLTLAKCGSLGGDVEKLAVIKELALRNPDDHFILVGRNSGEFPHQVGLPDNVYNPWTEERWRGELRAALAKHNIKGNLTVEQHKVVTQIFRNVMGNIWRGLDGLVLWTGQHGSSNMSIPKIDDPTEWTKPQDWCAFYAGYILDGVNQFREGREHTHDAIWLNADARNKHKMRDLKHSLRHPVLTQFDFTHGLKHEQYEADPTVITSAVQNVYSRLEINALAPGTPFGDLITYNGSYDRPYTFGMFINEARSIGVKAGMSRLDAVRDWVLPAEPNWIHGTWSNSSQKELDREIVPAPWDQYFPMLNKTLCTLTTPSSGSGWATTKPWEAFAAGTVCFFHPAYDTQNHILKDAPPGLTQWLRLEKPRDLKVRIAAICANPNTFRWIIEKQRMHFDNAMKEKRYLRMIESRLSNA